MLIGNLTRDPESTVTAQGTKLCNFSIATNRSWTTDSGEKKEETEYHRIIAWYKLAELCEQLLHKGSKVYVEGRIQTKKYIDKNDGVEKLSTEIVANDILVLSKKEEVEAI